MAPACINTHTGTLQVLLTDYPHISQLAAIDGGALLLAAKPQGPIEILHYSDQTLTPSRSQSRPAGGVLQRAPKYLCAQRRFTTSTPLLPAPQPRLRRARGPAAGNRLVPRRPHRANLRPVEFKNQYWTSRGFAVLDVNYRGSTGFGRAYRQSLQGLWGQADVEDLCNAAQWVSAQGLAGLRFIKGSSAGGFSVLAALAFHHSFDGGVSLYGIGDLALLAEDTHTLKRVIWIF